MGRSIQVTNAARVAILLLVLLAGCGTAEKTTAPPAERSAATDLRTAETDFRPSDHGREAGKKRTGDDPGSTEGQGQADSTAANASAEELVQGFRVQVFSTSDIDIAKSRMTEAETLFPSEWFYLGYDPPVYKIRAGNFLNRLDAERFMQAAQERGFRGAWVVPEKVITNPPPPPPRETPQNPK